MSAADDGVSTCPISVDFKNRINAHNVEKIKTSKKPVMYSSLIFQRNMLYGKVVNKSVNATENDSYAK